MAQTDYQDKVKNAKDEELFEMLKNPSHGSPNWNMVFNEIQLRAIKKSSKPHWSVTPLFWVSVIGTIAACVAAYPVLFPKHISAQSALPAPVVKSASQNKQQSSLPQSANKAKKSLP